MRRIFFVAGTVVFLAFLSIAANVFFFMDIFPFSSLNTSDYERVVGPYRADYAAQFPSIVPANAKAVRFYHEEPGATQGARKIQLRLLLAPDEIKAIRRRVEHTAMAKWAATKIADESKGMMPKKINPAVKGVILPPDYDVFLLKSTPEEEWNHPKSSGMAVSEKYNEVLYWLEDM